MHDPESAKQALRQLLLGVSLNDKPKVDYERLDVRFDEPHNVDGNRRRVAVNVDLGSRGGKKIGCE